MMRALLLGVILAGCYEPGPPDTVWIDPSFGALERAVIDDGLVQMCEVLGYCPTIQEYRGGAQITANHGPLEGKSPWCAGVNHNPTGNIEINDNWDYNGVRIANYPELFWALTTHEMLHWGINDHMTNCKPMQADNNYLMLDGVVYDANMCIPDCVVVEWCKNQGCELTKGNCNE